MAGLGEEGDGIDSNGYLVINGGTVIATSSTMDWAESDSEQVTMNLQFKAAQDPGEAIVITREDGIVVFAYDGNQDETTGDQFRGYQGAIISSPNLEVNKTYHVYVGGDVQGSDVDGLFDPDTVTKFNDAVKQEFTGTDVGMRGFGRGQRPEGQRPEGMEERPENAPVMVSTEFYMTDKVNAFSGVCDEGPNSPL